MEKVFLDTNTFIDLVEDRDTTLKRKCSGKLLHVSVASLGIWVYVYKHVVPGKKYDSLFEVFNFVDLTTEVVERSFQGPTPDYEDNIQLHCAALFGCDIFYTQDKKLLKLGYFGKVTLASP